MKNFFTEAWYRCLACFLILVGGLSAFEKEIKEAAEPPRPAPDNARTVEYCNGHQAGYAEGVFKVCRYLRSANVVVFSGSNRPTSFNINDMRLLADDIHRRLTGKEYSEVAK